jgi:hypothetical protein
VAASGAVQAQPPKTVTGLSRVPHYRRLLIKERPVALHLQEMRTPAVNWSCAFSAAAFGVGRVRMVGIYYLTIQIESIGLLEIAPLHEHQRTRAGLRRIGPHQPALSQQGGP